MIVDREGNVVYGESNLLGDDENRIREILDHLAPKSPAKSSTYNGTVYISKTFKRNHGSERRGNSFPCVVSDQNGELYLSVVSNRNKKNEVYLWIMRTGEGDDEPLVSEGCDDAYFATSIVDPDQRVWVFFTALADSGHYDIFARYWTKESGLSEIENLTHSDDDAMHPDAVVDASGRIWLTYYRWHKMGEASRDKEVYALCFDGNAWSKEELRLSPSDIPNYEDHTDPSIVCGPDGSVCVAWSWDLHKLRNPEYDRYRQTYGAHAPTIFARRFDTLDDPGDLLFLGHGYFDGNPELHLAADGKLWCAWNSMEKADSGYCKSFYTSVSSSTEKDRSEQYIVESDVRDICTPRFYEDDGTLSVYWSSQDYDMTWKMKRSVFKNGKWSKPKVIRSKGNPRFASLTRDKNGVLWLAYCHDTSKGAEIHIDEM